MTKRRVWDLSRILQHCRVTELVDVSDFDSDAAKLGGSSPSSVAIMPHIPSYGGEEGREGGVWDRAHKSGTHRDNYFG